MRENMSSRTLPASMISPVVPPPSPASLSAGAIKRSWTCSKSIAVPEESVFLPKGRITKARCIFVPAVLSADVSACSLLRDHRQRRDGLLLESSAPGQISKSGGRVAARTWCSFQTNIAIKPCALPGCARKRLRFVNNCLVCDRVGGVAAGSSVEHEKIACRGRGGDLLIIQRTPVAGTVNNRGLPESFRRERQHDASPQTKATSSAPCAAQTNKCDSMASRKELRKRV